jgi:uncharacterized membrane protein (GlpM family)
MTEYIKPEYLFLFLIMAPPAVVGAIFARNRGRNILIWGLLSALFPIFAMVAYFQKPLRDVPGGFKRCTVCGEFIKWEAAECKYCSAPPLSPPPE